MSPNIFQTNLQYKTLTWVHSPLMIALQWVSAGDEVLKWPQVKLNLCQTHMKQFIIWPDSLTLHVTPYWVTLEVHNLLAWSRASFPSIDPYLMVWSLILNQHKYSHQQTPQVSTTKLTHTVILRSSFPLSNSQPKDHHQKTQKNRELYLWTEHDGFLKKEKNKLFDASSKVPAQLNILNV